ncbi:unnamed protein product, partial [marine sediment metagenome]
MKVLIIGLGSIGTRYARLLHEHFDVELFALRHGEKVFESISGTTWLPQFLYSWD